MLLSAAKHVPHMVDVDLAEISAAAFGLQLAREGGTSPCILEMDSLSIFQLLNPDVEDVSEVGRIAREIKVLEFLVHQASISFTKRSGNEVAHKLAKLALSEEEETVWVEDWPPAISGLL